MGNPAIFIDFECRKDRSPTLLGVWKNGQITQWIVDSRLAGAAVARPETRSAELAAVAEALAIEADTQDCAIVGWSLFDYKRIVENTRVSKRARTILGARYVNAITPAKQWRKRYLPDWTISANELKLYFKATRFTPQLRRDIDTNPALWIKHVQDQIEKRGRYRDVTNQAKRDWHHLLTYNADDCRGLQHVFETTSHELALWDAYLRTTFLVDAQPNPIDIRIGWRRKKLDRLLEHNRVARWAFVTAWNPGSKSLSATENEKRHRTLITEVEQAGLRWLSGRGIGEDPSWPAEESLLILGCSEAKAVSFGRRFEQLAVVVGRRDEAARLLSCKGPLAAPTEDAGAN